MVQRGSPIDKHDGEQSWCNQCMTCSLRLAIEMDVLDKKKVAIISLTFSCYIHSFLFVVVQIRNDCVGDQYSVSLLACELITSGAAVIVWGWFVISLFKLCVSVGMVEIRRLTTVSLANRSKRNFPNSIMQWKTRRVKLTEVLDEWRVVHLSRMKRKEVPPKNYGIR